MSRSRSPRGAAADIFTMGSRSWDVERKSAPARRPAPELVVTRFARPSPPARGGRPLRERRRAARRRFGILIFVLLIAIIAGALWSLWQPWLRIGSVRAEGPYAETVPAVAGAASAGAWYGIVPRDSALFPAEGAMRAAILSAHPDITAVSIRRDGMTGLAITTIARASAFLWCGDTKPLDADSRCYAADAEGLIYAYVPTVPDEIQAAAASASGAPQVSLPEAAAGLNIYGPLVEASTTDNPIGSHVVDAKYIPAALQFARTVQSLGAPIESIQLRGDEADIYLTGGTRLTYVLGQEDKAAALAKAAFPQLDLSDGSIDYVDLRFDGKVYFKKSKTD
ncbi:MAG TPA: hypothetical protein VF439_01920 [Candidatus Paceibacterota bacterium]